MDFKFKIGDIVDINPELTISGKTSRGIVIKMIENSFIGEEVTAQSPDGEICWHKAEMFKLIERA